MSLTTGTRLGPYKILSALGAGGMGEVYRARDTKLDRKMALKHGLKLRMEILMPTRLRRSYPLAAFASVLPALIYGVLAQSSSEVGTWKMNLPKSTYSPGPAPKSSTTKIEVFGTGSKFIVDQVQADGSKTHWEYTTNYDGKDHPVAGNNPNADMASRTRINATTVQTIWKKDGKVTQIMTQVVSADGKTRTTTQKGINAAGQTVNNFLVYDRQ